ncbi:hypothetical protein LTR84_003658 [Exophiala bonariae]|uniref:Clr5 domain-containing protein n=1 Tax=Exophiala bonariae TaxID=1690606 RepID=A0AAV9N658_9EURO|nr:hypothetical protein LTR84_003658 [Exophiala bonariae]
MRPHILSLYVKENLSLEDVASSMKAVYGFDASARQYREKLSKWKIVKHVPAQIMRSAARKLYEKPKRHGFKYKQRAISVEDINRFECRNAGFNPASSPTISTSSEMQWDTSTSTDGSTTPQAGTPRSLGVNERPLDTTGTDIAVPLLYLSLEQTQRSYLGCVQAHDTDAQNQERYQHSSVKPQWPSRDISAQFDGLNSHSESLLTDAYVMGAIRPSRIKSLENSSIGFRTSRRSEEDMLSIFKAELEKLEARKFQKERTSLQARCHTRTSCCNKDLWACCECGRGPQMPIVHAGCPMCGHWHCKNCRTRGNNIPPPLASSH